MYPVQWNNTAMTIVLSTPNEYVYPVHHLLKYWSVSDEPSGDPVCMTHTLIFIQPIQFYIHTCMNI